MALGWFAWSLDRREAPALSELPALAVLPFAGWSHRYTPLRRRRPRSSSRWYG